MLVRSFAYVAFLALTGLSLATIGRAEPVDPEGRSAEDDGSVVWQSPFGIESLGPNENALLLMLVTNGDASAVSSSAPDQVPEPWCDDVLREGLRGLFRQRPDLRDSMVFQHLAAGTPALMTGGRSQRSPRQAMLVILDKDHRVLAWMVGVPESGPLIDLVEDAEEVQTMNARFKAKPNRLIHEIASRSVARLNRRWAAALQEQMLAMGIMPELGTNEDHESIVRSRLGLVASVFRRVYINDVALRFGLAEEQDQVRLAVLQQHPETRRPWCESMMPFVAGIDFESAWRPMVESVWNRDCVSSIDNADELIEWWDHQHESEPVVLSLKPPLLDVARNWPPDPVDGVAAKQGLDWHSLEEQLMTVAYREVNANELFCLMRDREIEPFDVRSPSRVRYLYFESKNESPVFIRENDVPGRHVAMVKRRRK